MADLSSTFESLGLATNTSPPPQHHTLNITYPALDLLPANATPYFYPPKDLRSRQRPKLGSYHLTRSNLAFFHRIPVNQYVGLSYPSSFSACLHAEGFLDLIASLTKAPGESTLEIVSFDNGGSGGGLEDVQHMFRAKISGSKPNQNAPETHTTIHTCQIPAAQLNALFKRFSPSSPSSEAGHHPWLPLVSNLINRTSDRAYLHVAERLQASTKKPTYRGEAARFARDWETSMPRSGSFLLASRLQCQRGDNNGSWVNVHDLDGGNLFAHLDAQMFFRLPCGHSASFALRALSAVEDSKSADVACPACGQRVLGEIQLAELALRLEHRERAAFCCSDAEHSDAKIPLSAADCNGGRNLELPPGLLYHALRYALESLRLPDSASPRALSLVDVSETRAVFVALALRAVGAGEEIVRLTLYELWEGLMETSMGTLTVLFEGGGGNLPPGFVDFLGKWLTRTVNLLAGDMKVVLEGASEELTSLMRTCQML